MKDQADNSVLYRAQDMNKKERAVLSTKPPAKKKLKTRTSQVNIASPEKSNISTAQYYILKLIACITMTIDHTAHFFQEQCKIPPDTYTEMKYVGRIAFPLFAYLMVESFRHTRSRKKHLLKIGILALVSELPFDVVYLEDKGIFTLSHQNVCVTMFLAFLCLMVMDRCRSVMPRLYEKYDMSRLGKVVDICFRITVAGAFAALAEIIKADFGASCILFVVLANYSRDRKHRYLILAFAFALFGVFRANIAYLMVVIPFVLIYLFEHHHRKLPEKKKDKDDLSKVICSKPSRRIMGIFYPVHLCLLIVIRFAMSV